jgi:2-oxo-4-hydroxy-4-carboxy-5-ureidoimidazoline decarboxylase
MLNAQESQPLLPTSTSNLALRAWNQLDASAAAAAILPCCGSQVWATRLAHQRPFADEASLLSASRSIWNALAPSDWQQAFDSHPRLGESKPRAHATAQALAWSASEQSAAMTSDQANRAALQEANRRYEARFGRIFILCARGRTTPEILAELNRRLANAPEAELREAAHEQAQITELRLRQWLADSSRVQAAK